MEIELSHSSLKFIEKLDVKSKSRIRGKLKYLKEYLEQYNKLPIKELRIKSLTGNCIQ